MKLESFKKLDLNAEMEESALNLLDLPTEMLAHVASFISSKKLRNFGLVNKKCNEVHRHVLRMRLIKCVDLRKFFYLNEEKCLEKVKDLQYKGVNLNMCYYLSPRFITELVSRKSLRELDLTECNCTPEVVETVAKLNLTSLTISLSKTWRDFFILNQNQSIAVLNGLKKMEIYHRFRSRRLMNHVSRYVLPHCRQLQYLKLFTPSTYIIDEEINEKVVPNTKLIPTPVPNLETLVLDFHNYDGLSQHIKAFFEVILHEKKSPITNVNLSNQTLPAILSEFFRGKNVSFEKADTLILDCFSVFGPNDPNFKTLDVMSVISSMPKCTKYKTICVEDFHIPNCSLFTEALVKSGNTSVEEINLNGCEFNDSICYFIDDIPKLSSGLTYLDISLTYWSRTLTENSQISNSDLMNSLSNLTNLRTLCIVPSMLSHKTIKDEDMLKSAFFEVANKCKSLRSLRIAEEISVEFISQDVLTYIKFFKNLRELYLVNFGTIGAKPSVLPEILEHCSKLKYLFIEDVLNETELDELFLHAKQIKRLFLDQNFQCTKTFVDNLSECDRLEKLYLSFSSDQDVEAVKYLAESLKKLRKLQFLSIEDPDGSLNEYFLPVYIKIKKLRPRFFFQNIDLKLKRQPVPMAHHQFFLR